MTGKFLPGAAVALAIVSVAGALQARNRTVARIDPAPALSVSDEMPARVGLDLRPHRGFIADPGAIMTYAFMGAMIDPTPAGRAFEVGYGVRAEPGGDRRLTPIAQVPLALTSNYAGGVLLQMPDDFKTRVSFRF